MDVMSFISVKGHVPTAGPQIQVALLDRRPSNMSFQTMMKCAAMLEFL